MAAWTVVQLECFSVIQMAKLLVDEMAVLKAF